MHFFHGLTLQAVNKRNYIDLLNSIFHQHNEAISGLKGINYHIWNFFLQVENVAHRFYLKSNKIRG